VYEENGPYMTDSCLQQLEGRTEAALQHVCAIGCTPSPMARKEALKQREGHDQWVQNSRTASCTLIVSSSSFLRSSTVS
jgi:hypothetical protein